MPTVELKDFIHIVRDELKRAYDARPSDPILALSGVDLEVSFTLSGKGNTKGKLLVVELEGEVSTERTHKVTLHLVPIAAASGVEEPFGLRKLDLSKLKHVPIAKVGRGKPLIP